MLFPPSHIPKKSAVKSYNSDSKKSLYPGNHYIKVLLMILLLLSPLIVLSTTGYEALSLPLNHHLPI